MKMEDVFFDKQDCKAAYSPKLAAAFKELVKSKNIGGKFEFRLEIPHLTSASHFRISLPHLTFLLLP